MNPRLWRLRAALPTGVVGFNQSIKFDANYSLAPAVMHTIGDIVFTMDPTGAVTGNQTTVTVKADGVHDLSVNTATLQGAGFDNTRDLLQTFIFTKTSGGYIYAITPGSIQDLDGPVMVYAHWEDDDRTLLRLEFDEELKNFNTVGTSRDMPAASSFNVSGLAVTDCFIGAYGSQLCVRVSAEVNGGESHTVSFANPTLNQLQDYAGNAAPNFAPTAIINNAVTRTTVLYDDFSIKPDGAVGAPITGPSPVEHDPYGGHAAIVSGKFTAAPGTGNGSSTTWDVGVTNYTLETNMGGSGVGFIYFRYVDENNYLKLSSDIYHMNLHQLVAGVDTVISGVATTGQAAGAASLTSLPSKVSITPTSILLYDYSGALVDTINNTQFASSTKVGYRFAATGFNVNYIKVRTPS